MEDLTSQFIGEEEQENSILVQEQKDPFKRLPDELIVSHIFDKICEAKSLCFCSLVSKHFSSLVYQTSILYFKIPRRNLFQQQLDNDPTAQTHPLSFPRQVLHFVTTPLRLVHGLFRSVLQRSQRQSRPFDVLFVVHLTAKFLTKFTSLKSLHIEFDYSGDLKTSNNSGLVVKWKFDSKSSSFVMLTARSLTLTTTDDVDVDFDENNINPRVVELLEEYFDCNMELADSRFTLVEMLAPMLPESRQNVVLTDSKREGKIDLGESDIVQMRNGNNTNSGDEETYVNLWYAPFLKLPVSGRVMKIVTLFISKDNSKSDYDDFLIAKEAFAGEEDGQIYVEAVMEMLKTDAVSQEILRAQDF